MANSFAQPVSVELPADDVARPLRPVLLPPRQFPDQWLLTASAHAVRGAKAVGRGRLAAPPLVDVMPSSKVPDEPPSVPAVEINLTELNARIGGYNLTLRALEAELDEQHGWTAQRLAPLVERLKGLVAQQSDLATYRRLVPAAIASRPANSNRPGR